jgi:putative transcriptional regulator
MPKQRIHSLRGSLLLDGGSLAGSYFHRSVVLVCQHDASGAFGLVLNRPDDRPLQEVLDVELPDNLGSMLLAHGGPVQETAMSFLRSDPAMLSANVMDQLQLGHDLEELIELGRAWIPGRRLRVFAGYAGWAPGQLDDELRREAWIVHPATLDLVFDVPPPTLWRHILKSRTDWKERLLGDTPENLSSN